MRLLFATGLLLLGLLGGLQGIHAARELALGDACKLELLESITGETLGKVRQAVDRAVASECEALQVEIFSPGGGAFESIEVAQTLRRARHKLRIETIGRSQVVSGATFILASGSPGHRYIEENAVFMVHGVQVGNYFTSECKGVTLPAETETDKYINRLIEALAQEYSNATGVPLEETEAWLICGNESVGGGQLAIDMGLADRLIK
jgi:ATP-dependent protease ClpP protease subunit